uniref:CASP-like protein n=1 Tax=Rhizophora mucronata TaxID=61149 RepID=A0A2P2IIL8_RHIMU
MAMMGSSGNGSNEDVKSSSMLKAEAPLRLVPMALGISALVLMLKNSQTNDFGSLSYSDLGAFRYLVHANGICAGYSLVSAIVVAMPRPSTLSVAWTFFCLDQVTQLNYNLCAPYANVSYVS